MKRPLPIGIDDFRMLRERGMEYVDKTHLIRVVLDKGAEVIQLPRPRRFERSLGPDERPLHRLSIPEPGGA